MTTGLHWIAFAALALIAAIPAAALLVLVFGLWRLRRTRSPGAKMMVGAGSAVLLLYASVITPRIVQVGPYQSGVLAHGRSPGGQEFCVVQTYKTLGLVGEPYQVSFYVRDANGAWRWSYLAHQDDSWRDVQVAFSGKTALVAHRAEAARELPMPTGAVDLATMRQGDDFLPAAFSANDVLKWHNGKFR